jgi:hypothetical protein
LAYNGLYKIHGFPNHGHSPTGGRNDNYSNNTNWTDGCVAVTNHEMDEIWNMRIPRGTPVRIL